MRRLLRWIPALLLLLLSSKSPLPTGVAPATWFGLSPEGERNVFLAAAPAVLALTPDSLTVKEMLLGPNARPKQWVTAPELVVLTSIMQFQSVGASEYVATSDVLTPDDVDGLVAELTDALLLLTGGTFTQFAGVHREPVAAGTSTRVIRRNQIVVGRFRNVRRHAGVIGLGGKSVRPDGAITAAVLILDDEVDRADSMRARLRTHELGHALGYQHVESRESIMNARIGSHATDLDRHIAAIAYRGISGSARR